MRKCEFVKDIVIVKNYVKLYQNRITSDDKRLTYVRMGQTLYPLHNFVVQRDKKTMGHSVIKNADGIMVLILRTLPDHALYLYKIS